MKVLQALYGGLGGHASVALSLVRADDDHRFRHHLLFHGIERTRPEYLDAARNVGATCSDVPKRPGIDVDSWMRALGAIETCNDMHFRSWLFAIAHNVLTDLHRSRHPEHHLDDAFNVPGREPSPEEAALARETEQTVSTLLAQLAPDQRSVLELRLAGLTSKEIGSVLNKHPNAVDQAQFRAMQRLRSLVAAGQPFLEGLR